MEPLGSSPCAKQPTTCIYCESSLVWSYRIIWNVYIGIGEYLLMKPSCITTLTSSSLRKPMKQLI